MRLGKTVLVILAAVICLRGQTPSASVVGRVVDASGAVIPGVAVKIVNLDTNQPSSGATNGIGDYTVPYLRPGRYSLEALGTGFHAYRHAEFELEVDQVLRVDIKLEVGATTESVMVTDTPPALNTDTGARGDVTTNAEITEMPLNGRNFNDLVYLTSGVLPKGDDADGQYSINGARADDVGFMVDGMNNTQRRNTGSMVSPSLESVQEFKLISSGFSAEYGRYAGGVLSVVTRSGGNRLRGTLFEFLRNDALDARNFFDVNKSKLRQNQFGATVSGPVVLPKIYNGKNRTFFLFSWEAVRMISGSTQRGIVPTAAMKQGDFSRATDPYGNPLKIIDPLAKNAPFPGNQIPLARLDPVSANLAAFYPLPNLTGSVNNYIAQANSTRQSNNYSIKVDHTIASRDRLTVSTNWSPSVSSNPFTRSPVALFGATTQSFGGLAGVRLIHTFTPVLYNEASFNASRMTYNWGWPGNTRDWSGDAGFVGGTRNPIDLGLPYVDVSGYIILGHAYDLPKIWTYNNYQATDGMTWIHGGHAVKFGAELLRYQYFNKGYGDMRGRLTFLGRFTNEPMADFMLGYVQSSRRQLDVSRQYLLASNYAGFAQDDYKVTPSLTLNLGIRYELMKPPREKFGARSTFVPELGKIVSAGTGGLPNYYDLIQQTGMAQYVEMASGAGLPSNLVRTRYNDFAPRFGFAWRPLNDNRTVVRGGYGIFFGNTSLYRYDGLTNTYPFTLTQTFSISSTNPLLVTVSNPFPVSRSKYSGITTTSGQQEANPTQYLQSWNLTVEREFLPGTVLEVAYAGSKGTHLPRQYDINQPIYDPKLKVGGTFPRPFPAFSSINFIADISNSTYNSGAATLRRRLNRDLFFRAAYTYSKSIDETSNVAGASSNFSSAQNSRNLHGERGRSDFNAGHTFLASFIWQPRVSRQFLLRDWQVSGTTTAYTGAPITVKMANYDATLGGAARPDRLAKGALANPSPDAWFNRKAFLAVPVGAFRFGNSGRNILDGPGTFSLNAGLSRRFRFSEIRALQFRLETFNLTNRTNFNNPVVTVDTLDGGTISQAKSPRLLQLGLRLEF